MKIDKTASVRSQVRMWLYHNLKPGQQFKKDDLMKGLPWLESKLVGTALWAEAKDKTHFKKIKRTGRYRQWTYQILKPFFDKEPTYTKSNPGMKKSVDAVQIKEDPPVIDPHILEEIAYLKAVTYDAAIRLERLYIELEMA